MASDIVKKTDYLALAGGDTGSVLAENLGGESLSSFDLDRVKMPSGGGAAWEIPSIEGSEVAKAIEGVIVAWTSPRAFWRSAYGEGDSAKPDCYSDDSITGRGDPGGSCDSCPMGEFGSDPDGRGGQWCKAGKLLFVLRKDSVLPIVVSLPATSIKVVKKFMLQLASRSIPFYGAEVSLSLDKEKSKDNKYEYSVLKPALISRLDADDTAAMKAYGAQLRPALSNIKAEHSDLV